MILAETWHQFVLSVWDGQIWSWNTLVVVWALFVLAWMILPDGKK